MSTFNNLTLSEFIRLENDAVTPIEIEAFKRLIQLQDVWLSLEVIQNKFEHVYDTLDELLETIDTAIDHINDDLGDDIKDNVTKYLSELQGGIDDNRETVKKEYDAIEFIEVE